MYQSLTPSLVFHFQGYATDRTVHNAKPPSSLESALPDRSRLDPPADKKIAAKQTVAKLLSNHFDKPLQKKTTSNPCQHFEEPFPSRFETVSEPLLNRCRTVTRSVTKPLQNTQPIVFTEPLPRPLPNRYQKAIISRYYTLYTLTEPLRSRYEAVSKPLPNRHQTNTRQLPSH